MTLKVIGAGFGRTGTESLKAALEQLGLGPCDHMVELIKSTRRVPLFEALHRGEDVDIDKIYEGFNSAVDFPSAMYYRQLMAHYPDAKIILTVRDAEAWYESARKTIFRGIPNIAAHVARVVGLFSKNAAGFPNWMKYLRWAIFEDFCQGKTQDKEYMMDLFNRWNQEVQDTVPPERLLVFQVKEGWEPLCEFLGVDVPSGKFPRSNDTDSFQERTKLRNMMKTIK